MEPGGRREGEDEDEQERKKEPGEKKKYILKQFYGMEHLTLRRGVGCVSAAYQRPRQEEAKDIHEPVYLTQDGSVRLWGRGKMTPNSSPCSVISGV